MNNVISRDQALFDLHASVCKVTFTKVDGTERVMRATLKEESLPQREGTATTTTHRSENLVTVWDVDKNDWRSFRLDKVTNWSKE